MDPISILIVDDHRLVREAWSQLLSEDKRFNVVSEIERAESAIQCVKDLSPDIVLLDISLTGINSIELTPLILQISSFSKVIGISVHASSDYARKIIKAGAKGYITKNSTKKEMIEAILEVHAGKTFICMQIKEMIANDFTGEGNSENKLKILSHRELQIIELLKKGMSSKEIAEHLSLSCKTVEVHRYNILRKLNFKNTAALINFITKQ